MTGRLTQADLDTIEAAVARAPEFTADQRAKLAELLRPVRKAGGGVCSTTRAAS